MASPNAVQFTDLKVTLVPPAGVPLLSEQSIADNVQSQVVVEVEAGLAVFSTNQPVFNIQAVVTDKVTGTVIVTPSATGNVGQGSWSSQLASIVLSPPIPAQGSGRRNHLYEVEAVLTVGTGDPEVEFAPKKVRFVVTRPS